MMVFQVRLRCEAGIFMIARVSSANEATITPTLPSYMYIAAGQALPTKLQHAKLAKLQDWSIAYAANRLI